jgi:hypothetical protein
MPVDVGAMGEEAGVMGGPVDLAHGAADPDVEVWCTVQIRWLKSRKLVAFTA